MLLKKMSANLKPSPISGLCAVASAPPRSASSERSAASRCSISSVMSALQQLPIYRRFTAVLLMAVLTRGSSPADRTVLAAGVVDDLAGDEAGLVGDQEGDHGGRVGRLPDPAERERGGQFRALPGGQ